MKHILLPVGVSLVLTIGAQALTVSVAYDAGTVNETTALTGFATSGDMMAGMAVTAYFSDGGSQSLPWATTGAGSGGVSGTDWSLSETGNTFTSDWTLLNSRSTLLTRLVIDAGPGDTVFDTTAVGDIEGTSGSARGHSFSVSSITAIDSGDTITATYHDAVALTGDAAVGDLFRSLDVKFEDGLSTGSELSFVADTDNLKFAGDIKPVSDSTTTLVSLASALGGLAILARRRSV